MGVMFGTYKTWKIVYTPKVLNGGMMCVAFVEAVDRANQIIISLSRDFGIVIFLQATEDFDSITVDLLQAGNFCFVSGRLLIIHRELGLDLHKRMTGETNGIKSLLNGGQHHFFQGIFSVTKDAVGM